MFSLVTALLHPQLLVEIFLLTLLSLVQVKHRFLAQSRLCLHPASKATLAATVLRVRAVPCPTPQSHLREMVPHLPHLGLVDLAETDPPSSPAQVLVSLAPTLQRLVAWVVVSAQGSEWRDLQGLCDPETHRILVVLLAAWGRWVALPPMCHGIRTVLVEEEEACRLGPALMDLGVQGVAGFQEALGL